MKKLILPLLLILGITMLVAVESAPSEVVGYFKKSITDGQWQAISLPFAYPSMEVNAVMGEQYTDNDVIMDINSGLSAAYFTGFGFFGDITDLEYGTAYFVNRAAGNGATDYYLLGKVDPQPSTKTIAGNGAFTAFGLNEAASVLLDDALFGSFETDGDVILDINTGVSATYYDGFGWFGDLTDIIPTNAYFYNTAQGTSSFVWTYTPTRGATSIVPNTSRNSK